MNRQTLQKIIAVIAVIAIAVGGFAWYWYRTSGPGKPETKQEQSTTVHKNTKNTPDDSLTDATKQQAQDTVTDWEKTIRSWGSPTVLDYNTQSQLGIGQAMQLFRAPQDGRLAENYAHAKTLAGKDVLKELKDPTQKEPWMESLWDGWGDYWASQFWAYGINPTSVQITAVEPETDGRIRVSSTTQLQAYVYSYPMNPIPGSWNFAPTIANYKVSDTTLLDSAGRKVLEQDLNVAGGASQWWLSPLFNGLQRGDAAFTQLQGGDPQPGFDIDYKGDAFNSQPYPMKPDPSFTGSVTMQVPNDESGLKY